LVAQSIIINAIRVNNFPLKQVKYYKTPKVLFK
jgi:hypothetical protein